MDIKVIDDKFVATIKVKFLTRKLIDDLVWCRHHLKIDIHSMYDLEYDCFVIKIVGSSIVNVINTVKTCF